MPTRVRKPHRVAAVEHEVVFERDPLYICLACASDWLTWPEWESHYRTRAHAINVVSWNEARKGLYTIPTAE